MQQHPQLQRSVKLLPLPPGIRIKLDNAALFTVEDVQRACAAGSLAQGKMLSHAVHLWPICASSRAVLLHCKCLGLTGNAGGADAQMTSVEASEVQRVINDVVSVQKSPLNGARCNSCTSR
jgi:hypothetical protein